MTERVKLVDPATGLDYKAVGTTDGSGNTVVVGNVAAATADSGNPVKVGGVYNATTPTLVDGVRGNLQLDSRGSLRVTLTTVDGTAGASVASPQDATTNGTPSIGARAFGMFFNGTNWDRQRKPQTFTRVASSAASDNPASVKASAGDVFQFWGLCGATAAYLQIYNKASAPVIGTDTPVLTFPIPANAAFSQAIPNGGAYLGTGIAYAFTTDAAGTTGSAAAAVTSFAMLSA